MRAALAEKALTSAVCESTRREESCSYGRVDDRGGESRLPG